MATTVPTRIDGVKGEVRVGVASEERALCAFEETAATRFVNGTLAAAVLLAASPVLAGIAVAIWLQDRGPVIFRQTRVGRNGELFTLFKFRSMRIANGGSLVTVAGDSRVTSVGRVLWKYKLHELPQLANVVRGDMNLVGPRPEVAKYVDMTQPVWQEVLRVRPGITDVATLLYRDEEQILSTYSDPDKGYRERVLPEKLSLNVAYLKVRSLGRDFRLLFLTARYSLLRGALSEERIRTLIRK